MKAVEAYHIGLKHFHKLLINKYENPKTIDQETFSEILFYATNHFGISAASIANRLNVQKSTISKWIHHSMFPRLATREITLIFILQKINEQLEKNV